MRLDLFLVKKSLAGSREKAKEFILSGNVTVDGKVCLKPAFEVEENEVLLNSEEEAMVGRGGKKLLKAIDLFEINLSGAVCLDAGASTGGFTEQMIKHGGAKVYAVDVGTDQLAEVLKNDKRVVNLEKTDIRNLELSEKADFFTADVSFISLTQILYHLKRLSKDNAEGVCLIKPQFEAGREHVGKKGVVKDKKVHIKVINDITSFAEALGFKIKGLTHSPISGQNGNIEYLMYLGKSGDGISSDTEKTVNEAWEELK